MLGTRLIVEAAARHGIGTFIFISTDKAVEPSSVMGATKRIGEQLVHAVGARAAGRFVIVRFGNVLGSQGSVLDLFREQIATGGPVTITHPDMSRYFMTIPEAARLILFAGATGRTGDIHVLNMGEPVRIVDLARDLIRLSVPGGVKDIAIVFTGLRPGEKLEETLFASDEEALPTGSEAMMVARPRAEPLGPSVFAVAEELETLARAGDDAALKSALARSIAVGVGTQA